MTTEASKEIGSSGSSSVGPTKAARELNIAPAEPSSSVGRSTLVADKVVTLRTVRGQSVTVPYDVNREETRRANRAANATDPDLVLDTRLSR